MEITREGDKFIMYYPNSKNSNKPLESPIRWVTSKDNYGRLYHFLINANGYSRGHRHKRVCPYMHSQ